MAFSQLCALNWKLSFLSFLLLLLYFFFSPLQGLLFLKTKLNVRLANSRSCFDRSLSVLGPEGAAEPLQAMAPGLLWPTGHSRRAGLGPACINPASRFVNKRLSDDLWLWKELTALSLVPGEATRKVVVSLLSFISYLHLFFPVFLGGALEGQREDSACLFTSPLVQPPFITITDTLQTSLGKRQASAQEWTAPDRPGMGRTQGSGTISSTDRKKSQPLIWGWFRS